MCGFRPRHSPVPRKRWFTLNKLLLIVFLFSQAAEAKVCLNTRFKHLHHKKNEILFLDVCKIKNYYLSKKCYKKKCKLKSKLSKVKMKKNPVGSPHYRLCREAGGVPISGQVWNAWDSKKAWKPAGFCFNKKKTEFLDFGYLIRTHKKK